MGDSVRPILKWAGGKRQLLPELRPFYPKSFDRYLEPFVGSGAVFVDLYNEGRLAGRRVRLSDVNADIIGCYRAVRDELDAVIEELRGLEASYRRRGEAFYYDVRDRRFNPARQARRPRARYGAPLAAMLIFLNRTGFNGLFRVNARGDFNVPVGRYTDPCICDEPNLRRMQHALRHPGLELMTATYHDALVDAGAGDFIYLDPPYAPVSATSRFTGYTAGGFGEESQARLQSQVIDLASRGASVLLSNSAAPQIHDLYDRNDGARRAGLRARTIAARRAINARATARGAVREYLITNVSRSRTAV
jgi:DNA adenine methylase